MNRGKDCTSNCFCIITRDVSVSEMRRLGGLQFKTTLIPGFHDLVHTQSNRPLARTHETKTWTFPLNKITLNVPECTEIWELAVSFSDLGFPSSFSVDK